MTNTEFQDNTGTALDMVQQIRGDQPTVFARPPHPEGWIELAVGVLTQAHKLPSLSHMRNMHATFGWNFYYADSHGGRGRQINVKGKAF